jgi:NDMA-dependent alcohol dehydrogenase
MVTAAVLRGVHQDLTIEDLDLEQPREGEVLVRMAASGVCHSDLSTINGTLFGAVPVVLGHEGAGVVEAVGPGVERPAVGEHVVISWVPQCGRCFFCRNEEPHLCTSGGRAMGSGGLLDGTTRWSKDGEPIRQMLCTGTFAERIVIPATSAVAIDPDIPLDAAALVGCAVLTGAGAALNTARIRPGATVAVLGCGGVGLNTIQGAVLAGAERVIAIDMVPEKLELARAVGATDVVDASHADAVAAVKELTSGRGADVGFEVIGLKTTIDQTIELVRRGGQVVLVGIPRFDVTLELSASMSLLLSAKSITGCWYGSCDVHRDVPRLLDWYREGRLKLDELISRRISLAEVNDAFRAMEAGEVARSVICYDADLAGR